MRKKEHFHIKIAEIGYCKPEGFRKGEFQDTKLFSDREMRIIDQYFINAWDNSFSGGNRETLFHLFDKKVSDEDSIYTIKSDTLFNYIDYLELQEARKNSRQAMITAIIAILLSLLAIGVQIYTSSSTEIEKEQFEEIKAIIQNIK